ncbi:helix-turn-helix domain-containing protein [Niallia taxi]|uniref:helix-turn-helix domain-containing protein n=1 Tax=Niallia taxi TaxID=2499688 RepID=UPI00300B7452
MSKLRRIRNKLNLSIDEVSRNLGISAGYLSQIELGKRQISNKRAEEIAAFYNLDKNQIFLPTRYSVCEVDR